MQDPVRDCDVVEPVDAARESCGGRTEPVYASAKHIGSADGRSQQRRTAVAVLLNYAGFFSEGIEGRLRRVFDAECTRRDWDLYLVYGRSINEPDPSCPAYNAVYDLIHPARVDAVVLVSNLLAGACGGERLNEYAKRFDRFPRCSLGMILGNLPSLEVDNRPGMEALVEHLVATHGHRRFVFMGGQPNHPHSQIRLEVCRSVLARRGLVLDENLVIYGDFMAHAAEASMDELLSHRSDFDVVVSANDAMALGVIASLRKHGRRVPDDCAVTGFDDLVHARLGNPAMTSVGQPLEVLAHRALDSIEAQLSGKEVPAVTLVAGELFIRNSCGCKAGVHQDDGSCAEPVRETALEHLRAHWAQLQREVECLLGNADLHVKWASERILRALETEVSGGGPKLVSTARELLSAVRDDPEQLRSWYSIVEYLEKELRGFSVPGLDASWRGTQREVFHDMTASLLQQQMAMDFTYVQLLGSEDNVFGALKLGALQESLRRHLPTAGIGTVSLSEYVDGEPGVLEPLVYFVDGEGELSRVERFPAHLLMPPGDVFRTRKTFVVMPLVFESRGLGMSVLEYATGLIPYNLLRDQISAALGTYRLQREIAHQSALRERSVQERVATNRRLESLSILAGGVAHDLNNVLGPLVAFPDHMLSQLSSIKSDELVVRELREDIELIKVAGQRASQTIKDLLTLSRQGRTAKAPIDVNQILVECGGGNATRHLQLSNSGPRIRVQIPAEPLVILASEAHIVRAVTNLLQNAIDVSDAKGEVLLHAYTRQIDSPLDRYETILPGEYVVIEVTDSGCGLPGDTRQRIFEPFFSTKRLSQRSGTGLGLAIVHGVVKEHDGFIDVDSAPGFGTTFTLYFPRSRSRVVSSRPPQAPRAAGERILVVDDDPIQLRTCSRVLTRRGYRVETTSSGLDACDRFARAAAGESDGYDLVVLDVQLSEGEDGLEVYEKIRKINPQQKAVLASGHAPTHRIEAALERGIPWLQKPYTADALADTVGGALDSAPPPVSRRDT